MQGLVLHEVGLRDGLQMEPQVVPTGLKQGWAERLIDAGVDVVQVGSFVSPARVPQMADTELLLRRLRGSRPHARTLFSALALNMKGVDRAIEAGVDLLCMGVSASETHSRCNTGKGIEENVRETLAMAARAMEAGLPVQVSVQSAFGCGFEGPVPPSRVVDLARRLVDSGAARLSLADTAGHATPEAVASLFPQVAATGAREMACHFHNTYGLAFANCRAALQSGVTWVETSVAGLGGCPFTALAGGNTCTEDFVQDLHRRGLRADIELGLLVGLAREVAAWFGRDVPSTTGAHRVPAPVA